MVINCVLNLMKMSHMDSQNSTVFIFANFDKPYYKMEWVYEKLPKNVKSRFDNYKSLKIFLFRSSRTFLIIGNFIQLRTKLVDLPCDKSISLEILRLQQRLSSPSVQVRWIPEINFKNILELVWSQKSPNQETGLGNRGRLKVLNVTKLILND